MIGDVLLNKYRIVKELGSGGCGIVYLVQHVKLHNYRAVKCIPKSEPMYQQAINESNILSNLKHCSIPILFDCEEDDDTVYLIMEYCDGTSLRAWKLNQNNISEDMIILIALQICEVIQYLHSRSQPILYLDLKPDNVIINENTMKLIDFGTALYAFNVTDLQYVAGTRGYAAPELYGMDRIDTRCDIYGIGMLLYFMITGVQFRKEVSQLRNIDAYEQYSLALRKVVNLCLHRNPALRYQTVQELSKALERINDKGRKAQACKRANVTSLTFAIAGTQGRIGTTHIALTLAKYISRYYRKCLYMERNNTMTSKEIIRYYDGKELSDGVYQINSNFIRPWYELEMEGSNTDFLYEIEDYGQLQGSNLEEFSKAKVKLLVIGTKPWEYEQTRKMLRLLHGEDIILLANISSIEEYSRFTNESKQGKVIRVPYLNGLFSDNFEGYILDFVREILFQSNVESDEKVTISRLVGRFGKYLSHPIRRLYEATRKT
ncbi:MAG TPA: serine/threonine-protein kinase [Lachnospiraceae bacterium]|nr:serine/threonine-protein kinase [Lachnospiraceae bacterium]